MDPAEILFIIGSLLLLGISNNKFFHITGIPNSIILIVSGIIINIITSPQQDIIDAILSVVGSIALVLILFEGGIELQINRVRRNFWVSILIGVLAFILSNIIIFFLILTLSYIIQIDISVNQMIALSIILGGTSPAIVIPIVSNMKINTDLKTILILESTISELCTVTGILFFINILSSDTTNTLDSSNLIITIIATTTSLIIAAILGLIWGMLSKWLNNRSHSYMLLFSFLLILYYIVDVTGGKPVLAIFFFGFIMANTNIIVRRLRPSIRKFISFEGQSIYFTSDQFHIKFNAELSFLVRVFFFVLLGIKIDISSWNSITYILIIIIPIILLLGRWIAIRISQKIYNSSTNLKNTSLLLAMSPRGLACAVMAIYAIDAGIFMMDHIHFDLLAIVFGAILTTNLSMAIILQITKKNKEQLKLETKKHTQEK